MLRGEDRESTMSGQHRSLEQTTGSSRGHLLYLESVGFSYQRPKDRRAESKGGREPERGEELSGVSMSLDRGQLLAIVGPNGAGKSTLLGVCAGIRSPYSGSCVYAGREVRGWNRKRFAREVAFVPQNLTVEFPFTATQVVMMGRVPYGDGLFESEEDQAAAQKAMELTDAVVFGPRDFRSLSGGERQRVILAAALAQSPNMLLLDEPTTFLDLKHQIGIYSLLRDLARSGMLVLTVTHDLNLALTYADQVLVLEQGRMRVFGRAEEVLNADTIQSVFGVTASVQHRPDGRRWVAYG